jgi:hypothetical protein
MLCILSSHTLIVTIYVSVQKSQYILSSYVTWCVLYMKKKLPHDVDEVICALTEKGQT